MALFLPKFRTAGRELAKPCSHVAWEGTRQNEGAVAWGGRAERKAVGLSVGSTTGGLARVAVGLLRAAERRTTGSLMFTAGKTTPSRQLPRPFSEGSQSHCLGGSGFQSESRRAGCLLRGRWGVGRGGKWAQPRGAREAGAPVSPPSVKEPQADLKQTPSRSDFAPTRKYPRLLIEDVTDLTRTDGAR